MTPAPSDLSFRHLSLTRRAFLGSTAAAAIVHTAGPAVAANDRIGIGLIGHGVMGRGHLSLLLGRNDVQVTAVCDVDKLRRDEALLRVEQAYSSHSGASSYRGCASCNDFRELLARPDVDAVVIVTPDHWHTPISVEAARAGKDVYCEKPVSLSIHEGRRLAEVVRTYGRVFQTGTQYRSMTRTRQVCEFVRSGGLGPVRHAFAIWSKCEGMDTAVNPRLPAEPVPEGLDWDLWVGPAPWHDYNRRYHRNPAPGVVPWAFCEDFGAASVTWHHSHSADVIQYALGDENSGPVEVIHPSSGEFPTLTYRYANGALLHLVYHWGQVKEAYHLLPEATTIRGGFGGLFVGERGWVTALYGGGQVQGEPESIFREMRMVDRVVTGANNHHENWIECIRSRARTSTDAEVGHRSASLGHLASVAFKLGRSLRWDPVKEEFAGDDEANRLRSRAMREPWRC